MFKKMLAVMRTRLGRGPKDPRRHRSYHPGESGHLKNPGMAFEALQAASLDRLNTVSPEIIRMLLEEYKVHSEALWRDLRLYTGAEKRASSMAFTSRRLAFGRIQEFARAYPKDFLKAIDGWKADDVKAGIVRNFSTAPEAPAL